MWLIIRSLIIFLKFQLFYKKWNRQEKCARISSHQIVPQYFNQLFNEYIHSTYILHSCIIILEIFVWNYETASYYQISIQKRVSFLWHTRAFLKINLHLKLLMKKFNRQYLHNDSFHTITLSSFPNSIKSSSNIWFLVLKTQFLQNVMLNICKVFVFYYIKLNIFFLLSHSDINGASEMLHSTT